MNDYWLVLLALVSLAALVCGLLVAAWSRGRLGIASAALLALALAAWLADVVAISSGVNDADGFLECRDLCTPTHRLVALGFIGPPLFIAFAAAGMAIALLARARNRRQRA